MSLLRVSLRLAGARRAAGCMACGGMGLFEAESGVRNEWDLCQRCAGSGVGGCPVRFDAVDLPGRLPSPRSTSPADVGMQPASDVVDHPPASEADARPPVTAIA